MTIEVFRHRLECLGWDVRSEWQQPDGRWTVLAITGCDTILATADNRHEVWSAAYALAMKLTWEEPLRLPFRP